MAIEPVRGKARHLSEFKLERMELICSCGRRGSYNVANQIEAYGDMLIWQFIEMKAAAVCKIKMQPGKYRTCHAGCDQLLGMFDPSPCTLEWAVENGYRNPDGSVKMEE